MKKNDDFRFYVQIPNFLTSEKCQEIIEAINDNEKIVDGCVSDDSTEHRENTIIPEVRITKESYLLEQPQDYNNRTIPEISEGDILAFKNAGAYCFTMSSNYNSRYRPAEVLLYKNNYHLIRKKENMTDILNNQILIDIN